MLSTHVKEPNPMGSALLRDTDSLGVVLGRGVAMHEVVWRPGARQLHPALLQLLSRRRVFILVPLYRPVIDQVGDIEQHLAGLHPLAKNS